MSKILFLVNHASTLSLFRTELVDACLEMGHTVYISSPPDPGLEAFAQKGCILCLLPLSRHGINPLRELAVLHRYRALLRKLRPDYVFSYTIKPNLYGAMACHSLGIPLIANITGLGRALENRGPLRFAVIGLYRYAFRNIHMVFFQNHANRQFFIDHRIPCPRHVILPGSGVNLTRFTPLDYPPPTPVRFLFVGRITESKGIREYLEAARTVKRQYPQAEFHICGACEKGYENLLKAYEADATVIFHGEVSDTRPLMKNVHCIVLPSYHEGMANALLEAAACARPIIASNIPGCRETFDPGVSGIACEPRSSESLALAMIRFLQLSKEEKLRMGLAGHQKIRQSFDRQIVIDAYLSEIAP
ncbi:MAG: glycosyltransferase family 4 protein [Ruminococcaceae bacterium]|nr:glycosyltransferase family 4 protein [Oscillospiraceae bacterium]